jgi:hypothetical protein
VKLYPTSLENDKADSNLNETLVTSIQSDKKEDTLKDEKLPEAKEEMSPITVMKTNKAPRNRDKLPKGTEEMSPVMVVKTIKAPCNHELLVFILESDWGAISKYIASMHDSNVAQHEARDPETSHLPGNDKTFAGPAQKRFGARSQLQHNRLQKEDLHSASSWDDETSFDFESSS